MGERLVYNPDNFPFMAVFDELTGVAIDGDFSPIEAYVWYQNERAIKGLRPGADYCSTALTNMGHQRNPKNNPEDTIAKNTASARKMMLELTEAAAISPRDAILPADLGYIPAWKQSDYMGLWLCVIAGVDLDLRVANRGAGQFEQRVARALEMSEVSLEVMNDRGQPAEERAPEYFKFAGAYAAAVSGMDREPHSAHRLINLWDTSESLGCRTERLFAHTQNVPAYDVAVAGPGPSPHDAVRNASLRSDLDMVVSYGAAQAELLPGNNFVLRSGS